MTDSATEKKCLACGRDEHATPLICIDYQGERTWICPQHMPILIHNPAELDGMLDNARNLKPADHHD